VWNKGNGWNKDERTNSKIKEIESTLGTLSSLIDEYRRKENEEGDEATETGSKEMEVELDRISKRKKDSSSEAKERNIDEEDSDTNIRPVRRAATKSKIDLSLPMYRIESSSNEGTSDVEITGVEIGSERKKVKTTKRIKKKSAVLNLKIKEISGAEECGNYDNITAPTMGSIAIEWLNDIEHIRKKCGNIQEKLFGQIKESFSKRKS